MKTKVTMELDVPEGWEATGEYRRVRVGEHYLNTSSTVSVQSSYTSYADFPILRKKLELKVGEVAVLTTNWKQHNVLVMRLDETEANVVFLESFAKLGPNVIWPKYRHELTPTGKTVPEFYAGGGKEKK